MRTKERIVLTLVLIMLACTYFSTFTCSNDYALAAHGWQHQNNRPTWLNRTVIEIGKSLGSFTALFFIITVFPYLLRQHIIPNLNDSNQIKAKQFLKWLKNYHYFVGLTVATLALVHGLIMILAFSNWNLVKWMGMLTTVFMLAGATYGINLKMQKKCSKSAYKIHKAITLIIGTLAVIHIGLT